MSSFYIPFLFLMLPFLSLSKFPTQIPQSYLILNSNSSLSVYDPIISSTKNFLKEIFENDTVADNCYSSLNITSIPQVLEYSGEDVSDLGNEFECVAKGYRYFIFIYTFKTDKEQLSDPSKKEIITLLNSTAHFYTGLCIPESCTEFLKLAFTENNNNNLTDIYEIIKNHNLTKYLDSIGITNMKYVKQKNKTESENSQKFNRSDNTSKNNAFIIIVIILAVYLIVKLLFSIIYECCYSNKSRSISNNDKGKSSNDNKHSNRPATSNLSGSSNSKSKKKSNSLTRDDDFLFNNTNYIDNSTEDLSNKSLAQRVMAILSFSNNIDILSANRSLYFDESNLKVLSFIKTIIMYLLVYNHNYFSSITFPGRDFFNDAFYKNFLFSTIKITVYSADCFVALEAFVMIFKLMSFLREKYFTKSEPLYKLLLVFFVMTIPKIILFFLNFYILHFFMPDIASSISDSTWNKYYLKIISSEKSCEDQILKSLMPFYLAYNDFNDDNFKYNLIHCHRFFYVFINEFICYIVFMIIFFIMLKLKSKIFDAIIAIVVLLNTICSFISFEFGSKLNKTYYDTEMILGQILTLKHTHLLFNTYMFGIFMGMVYFYYNDYLLNHSIQKEHKYYPFSFCSVIVPLLDINSSLIKGIVLTITIIIQIMFGLSYNIFRLSFSENDNNLAFLMNSFVKWFDVYDKQIYVIVFLIMTILLMFTSKDNVIHNIASFRLFNLISRISFSLFSSLDYIIYLTFVVFNFQIKMSYANMLFISVGQFIIVVAVCTVFTILFEFPFRVIVKTMLRKYTRGDDAGKSMLDDKTVYY